MLRVMFSQPPRWPDWKPLPHPPREERRPLCCLRRLGRSLEQLGDELRKHGHRRYGVETPDTHAVEDVIVLTDTHLLAKVAGLLDTPVRSPQPFENKVCGLV